MLPWDVVPSCLARPGAARRREPHVFERIDARSAASGFPGDLLHGARRDAVTRRQFTAGLAVAAGLALGACTIPFGDGASSTGQSSAETRRESNRRYLEEQQLMEQQRQFD